MTHKISILAVWVVSLPFFGFSQQKLTQADVVKMTLENNYGIQLAKNNVEIARNNTDRGLNGYIPSLNASAGPTASLSSSSQKFNGPLEDVEINNAFSWAANASVAANYTVFDKARDYNLDQLKEVLNLTDLQLRQTIEVNVLQVLAGYYEVAKLSENVLVLEDALDVSSRRLERAQYRFDYGQGLRLDVLNAEVDSKRDSVNLLNMQQQLANAKRNLNVLMGVPVDSPFLADNNLTYNEGLLEQTLIDNAKTNNIAILAANQNLVIREMDLSIIDAGRKPTVGARVSYDYNYQDNAAGSFIASNRTNGLNGGVTLNWNIFDGGRRKIQEQNTQLAIRSQLVQKQQLQQELERDVRNAWESYQNALFVQQLERSNVITSQLNLDRTRERFEAGQITSVEFRQAQLNFMNASVSYNAAKYNAKVIELQLLQLSGGLLENL